MKLKVTKVTRTDKCQKEMCKKQVDSLTYK